MWNEKQDRTQKKKGGKGGENVFRKGCLPLRGKRERRSNGQREREQLKA